MENYRQPGRPDIGQYLRDDKSDYPLWRLLLYMGQHVVPQTLAYFQLPADTRPFLQWVSDWVSQKDRDQVPELAAMGSFGAGANQMSYLPYAALYAVWERADAAQRKGQQGNILVYLDRITDQQGRELARYDAPLSSATNSY